MNKTKKTSVGISPFNCISMKDVKDKNSGKVGFRNLFDCVTSLDESVTKLRDFIEELSQPDERISSHINTLTGIQKDLLSICQERVGAEEVPPVIDEMEAEETVDVEGEVPVSKSKIRL